MRMHAPDQFLNRPQITYVLPSNMNVALLLCTTARGKLIEDTPYALESWDGRFLVADTNVGGALLRDAEELRDGRAQHTFHVMGTRGGKRLFLRFGDVLLNAHDADGRGAGHADATFGARWHFHERRRGGITEVALRSAYGSYLRPSADGQVEQRRGGWWTRLTDSDVWWVLHALPQEAAAASRPAALGMLFGASGGRSVPQPAMSTARRRRTAWLTPRRVYGASTVAVVLGTAALPWLTLDADELARLSSAAARVVGGVARLCSRVAGCLPLSHVAAAKVQLMTLASRAGAALGTLRSSNAVGLVLAHGLVTDLVADALAQALHAHRQAGSGTVAMRLDGRRLARSTAVSIVSDDLPFVLWARLLWGGFERLRGLLIATPLLSDGAKRVLTHPLAFALGKTAVTQLVYEAASTAIYLSLQALLRGDGAAAARRELKEKFLGTWADGVLFFSATNVLMFLLPVWWLQPVVDNLACLAFNTYLSLVSHGAAPPPPPPAPPSGSGEQGDARATAAGEGLAD